MANEKRAVLKGTLAGVNIRNMFVAQVQLNEGETAPEAMAEYVSAVLSPILGRFTGALVYSTLETQTLIAGSWFSIDESAFSRTGSGGGEVVANVLAQCIVGTVGLYHGRGRKFFSGLSEDAVQGNVLHSSALANFVSAAAAYVTPFTTTGGSLVTPGIIGKDGTFYAFAAGFVSSVIGTMRRRKPGIGI